MATPYRVIFMGTPSFAVPSLRALIGRPSLCTVDLVVCQPDRRAGRGRRLVHSPVKTEALAADIDVFQPVKMKSEETYERLRAVSPDVVVVAAYGRILPQRLLDLPRFGCLNVHASLLPSYRGASPIARAIADGQPKTGVTIMHMEAGLDTGPTYSAASLELHENETCETLTDTLAETGAQLLVESLPGILEGRLQAVPQNEDEATLAPLLSKEDGRLDFADGAQLLERRIRAYTPWPGCYAFVGEHRIQFLGARASESGGEHGKVVAKTADGFLVGCAVGGLEVTMVKPAGKKAMSATAWLSGRGIAVGDIFHPYPKG